jgi:hypothetical protein
MESMGEFEGCVNLFQELAHRQKSVLSGISAENLLASFALGLNRLFMDHYELSSRWVGYFCHEIPD